MSIKLPPLPTAEEEEDDTSYVDLTSDMIPQLALQAQSAFKPGASVFWFACRIERDLSELMKPRMAGQRMEERADERKPQQGMGTAQQMHNIGMGQQVQGVNMGQRGGMMHQAMVPQSQKVAIQSGANLMRGVPKIGGWALKGIK
jgi:hypothetical protein